MTEFSGFKKGDIIALTCKIVFFHPPCILDEGTLLKIVGIGDYHIRLINPALQVNFEVRNSEFSHSHARSTTEHEALIFNLDNV